jgi:hypothetical protein
MTLLSEKLTKREDVEKAAPLSRLAIRCHAALGDQRWGWGR